MERVEARSALPAGGAAPFGLNAGVPHYSAQADSRRAHDAQDAQALLRYAHPQLRLKQQLLTSGD